MKPIFEFNVKTILPDNLKKLEDIANNYWWSWNSDAKELFHQLDRELFVACNHNPIQLINRLSNERLQQLSNDKSFIKKLERV